MRTLLCLGVVLAFTAVAAAEDKDKEAKHMRGTIVKVDADGNTLTVKIDDKEQQLKVNATTKYWGNDKKPLTEGLKAPQFKEGTQIWYRTGKDEEAKMITELRFFDPAGAEKEPGK